MGPHGAIPRAPACSALNRASRSVVAHSPSLCSMKIEHLEALMFIKAAALEQDSGTSLGSVNWLEVYRLWWPLRDSRKFAEQPPPPAPPLPSDEEAAAMALQRRVEASETAVPLSPRTLQARAQPQAPTTRGATFTLPPGSAVVPVAVAQAGMQALLMQQQMAAAQQQMLAAQQQAQGRRRNSATQQPGGP